jgi:pimeloyl-ACP methyl ester carboxylesterase
MAWRVRLALVSLLVAPAAGPARANPEDAGVVFVVGGIGGIDPLQAFAPLALPWAGLPHQVRVFEWTHGKGRLLLDLQDEDNLQAQGARLAEEVQACRACEPDRPVYLLGHSAGAGVILAAAEHLPPRAVERIVLLSAAVSPGYDLRPALRATHREVVSFYSTGDRLFLDWGTSLFGTTDRVYGPSAGAYGFVPPECLDAGDRKLYGRLVQISWRLEMCLDSLGGGSHHANCTPLFLARRVAPWLLP